MALHIIPQDLSGCTPGEKKIVEQIKKLYNDEARSVFLYVKPRLKHLEPDFILIDSLKGVSILEIKDWSLSYIHNFNRTQFVDINNKKFYNPAFRCNQYFNFAKSLFEGDPLLFSNENGELNFKLYAKVIFVNMSLEDVQSKDGLTDLLVQPPSQIIFSDGANCLSEKSLFGEDSASLNNDQVNIIRKIFYPEIEIFDNRSCNSDIVCDFENHNYSIKTLDFQQEKYAKKIPYGHYMISGVPGSGKTVILLARALFLVKSNPEWIVKIVTYNKSLAQRLRNSLNNKKEQLDFAGIKYDNIEISTFHQFAKEIAKINVPYKAGDDFWNKDLPKIALEKAEPLYDAVLIDEYQDFYDDWIRLCIKTCKKHKHNDTWTENLFLAGDRVQSIYNPNLDRTWKDIGVQIQGGSGDSKKSELLKMSYRSGKSHVNLAIGLLLTNTRLSKLLESFYEGIGSIQAQENQNEHISIVEGNLVEVINILKDLVLKGIYQYSDILILSPTHDISNQFFRLLPTELRDHSIVTKDIVPDKMNITTYHSSKGLESKVCVMLNVDHFSDKRNIIKQMLLLYVGITRASKDLYIHAYSFKECELAKIIKKLVNGGVTK